MKVPLRRIGNSLGVLIPKTTLDAWGLGEGDALELSGRGLRPIGRDGFSHRELEAVKRDLALAIAGQFTPSQIRAQVLANLHRWKSQGMWVPAFDEWQAIARSDDDGELFAAMLSRDEKAVMLRQSAPYAGLLSQQQVGRVVEEAPG